MGLGKKSTQYCVERIPTGTKPKVATWDKPAVAPLGVNDVIRGKQKSACVDLRGSSTRPIWTCLRCRAGSTRPRTGRSGRPPQFAGTERFVESKDHQQTLGLWREGLNEWTRIDELHALKRILWDYPALPETSPSKKSGNRNRFVDMGTTKGGFDGAQVTPRALPDLGEVVPDSPVEDIDAELAKLRVPEAEPPSDEEVDAGDELDKATPRDDVETGAAITHGMQGPFSAGELRDATRRVGSRTIRYCGRAPGPESGHRDDAFGPLMDKDKLPLWGRRRACGCVQLEQVDVSMACELCGNLATVHSVDALPLQLREGDDTPLDRNRPPRIICTEARAGGSLDAKELVDGRVWVSGKESEKEPLAITHVVRVLREAPERPPCLLPNKGWTSRSRKSPRAGGWEQRCASTTPTSMMGAYQTAAAKGRRRGWRPRLWQELDGDAGGSGGRFIDLCHPER